jgi:catechol 2,3-dioxygenase-like lactoylglutathione lyase family enzyme
MIRGGYVTLNVACVATAVRFYVETLGMKLVGERDGAAFLDAGEGFVLQLAEGTGRSSAVVFRTKVPLAEAIAIYTNRGVAFDGPRFRDPDGNTLTLTA